ncbi:MAG: hypothetical protein ACHP79_14655, partial [Terriglobales bacterium]
CWAGLLGLGCSTLARLDMRLVVLAPLRGCGLGLQKPNHDDGNEDGKSSNDGHSPILWQK